MQLHQGIGGVFHLSGVCRRVVRFHVHHVCVLIGEFHLFTHLLTEIINRFLDFGDFCSGIGCLGGRVSRTTARGGGCHTRTNERDQFFLLHGQRSAAYAHVRHMRLEFGVLTD